LYGWSAHGYSGISESNSAGEVAMTGINFGFGCEHADALRCRVIRHCRVTFGTSRGEPDYPAISSVGLINSLMTRPHSQTLLVQSPSV
jgi:hypothetical protein